MKCPSAEKALCPSKDEMEEHTNEWWTEYYCQTCGHEGKVHFTSANPRPKRRQPAPVPPVRRINKKNFEQ